jgi:hypothetical protein
VAALVRRIWETEEKGKKGYNSLCRDTNVSIGVPQRAIGENWNPDARFTPVDLVHEFLLRFSGI